MKPNAEVKETGTVYDGLLEQVEQNARDQKALGKEMDRLRSTILKGSIEYQKLREENAALKRFNEGEVEEVIKSHAFLDVFLEEQESIFYVENKLASPEIAIHYLAAANHRKNQGREGDRIQDVQNWIDNGN